MAKVIKVDPPAELLVKHKECGATIQYELRDIEERYSRDYDGSGDTYCYAICPYCGKPHSWLKRY